jgi:hypothetical protein
LLPRLPFGGPWGRYAVEVALERIYARRPISSEWRHPRVYFLQRLRQDAIDAALCVDRRLYEARISQYTKMLRYRGLREIERRLEIADGALATGKESQDGPATWLGEDSECGFHAL